MMKRSDKRTEGGLSRLDMTVGAVAVTLLLAVIAVSLVGHPAQAGERVAYLAPADSTAIQNLYLAPLDNPDAATAVTDAPLGVYNYDVSKDGRYIAYAARDPETRFNDIWLIDLYNDQTRRLTDCARQQIDCRTPVFRPGDTVLAYERQNSNADLNAVGTGAIRIWLLDYASGESVSLTNDSQLVGHSPQWSDDGSTVAFYSADLANPGIYIYEFETADAGQPRLLHIPSAYGTVGDLSPNGDMLIYPDVVQRSAQQFGTYLKIISIANNVGDASEGFQNLSDKQGAYDDTSAEWYPDGQSAAILRRYSDERYTSGFQVYQITPETGEATPVVVDERYNHSALSWNTTGDKLLMQRFPLLNADGEATTDARPQIWLWDAERDKLVQVQANAFLPQWVAGR